jgi:hypothetical protein
MVGPEETASSSGVFGAPFFLPDPLFFPAEVRSVEPDFAGPCEGLDFPGPQVNQTPRVSRVSRAFAPTIHQRRRRDSGEEPCEVVGEAGASF